MDNYRVLLVDDEAHIRTGIRQRIDWDALSLTVVGEAENGQEALELAEQLRPDIILTDIQMPFMNGLTLCETVTKQLPATKFVVFSGFDDFEYAQQAIRMQVFEYLLKPVDGTELTEVLRKLKTQLDEEQADRQNLDRLRHLYEESLPVLRELFLTRLIEGRTCGDRLLAEAQQHNLNLAPQFWQVALLHLEGVDHHRELVLLSLKELLDEHLTLSDATCIPFLHGDGVAVLVGYPTTATPYQLMDALGRICQLSTRFLDVTITIGLGLPCPLADLPLSTSGAHNALEYRVLHGIGRAIYIGDVEPDTYAQLTFDDQDERILVSAVKLGSEAEIRTAVDGLVSKMQRADLALSQCHIFFLELLNCLLKLARGADLDVATVFGDQFVGTMQVTDFPSPQALGQWYLDRCLTLGAHIGRQRTDTAGRTIKGAQAFITDHFAQSDLSVETLCDHLHLSPAYFSTLFKRETGMSFTGYVTEVRMEKAAQLLRQTEEKTYRIAELIGYDDPNYFSYVFKKHFGLTPTKYRAG